MQFAATTAAKHGDDDDDDDDARDEEDEERQERRRPSLRAPTMETQEHGRFQTCCWDSSCFECRCQQSFALRTPAPNPHKRQRRQQQRNPPQNSQKQRQRQRQSQRQRQHQKPTLHPLPPRRLTQFSRHLARRHRWRLRRFVFTRPSLTASLSPEGLRLCCCGCCQPLCDEETCCYGRHSRADRRA